MLASVRGAASLAEPQGALSQQSTDARFHHVHLDLVGPLSPSRGHCFLLTCGDHFSRWYETIPLVDIHTATVILTILQNWIARFGAPNSVTTNRGPQFESTLFDKLSEFPDCKSTRTTAYHPAANGMVERLHRHLKFPLMLHAAREHWVDNLPIVLLGIRSSLKPDVNACLAELVYGSTIRLHYLVLMTLTACCIDPRASPMPHPSSTLI